MKNKTSFTSRPTLLYRPTRNKTYLLQLFMIIYYITSCCHFLCDYLI